MFRLKIDIIDVWSKDKCYMLLDILNPLSEFVFVILIYLFIIFCMPVCTLPEVSSFFPPFF